METHLATIEDGNCKAEIYETAMPGQFSIHYCGEDGTVMAEEPLTGVSTYKQREVEIRTRLIELCKGGKVPDTPLSDAGEY